MTTLEEIICGVDHIKEAKLFEAAQKAFIKPETGIQIVNPAAQHVIKDCAFITTQYLPFFVISKLGNFYSHYQKKVTLDQIKDFYNRSQSNAITNQLLTILLDKAKVNAINQFDTFYDRSDPYNDFEEKSAELQKYHSNILLLSKAFGILN